MSGQPDISRTGPETQPLDPPRLLGRSSLLGVTLRIFFLEALWNPQSQQGLGLLTAIDPALRIIYAGQPGGLKAARKRNLDFFNTNPVSSGLVIGAALRLEEDLAAGEITPDARRKVVQALASTLAGEGDQLFWQSWLPFCCLAGILLTTLTGSLWAPLLIPVLFSALTWPVRLWGVFKGYGLGYNVYRVYQLIHGERLIWALQWLWTLILALLTARAALGLVRGAASPGWPALPWAILSIAALWLYRRLSFGHRHIMGFLLYPVLLAVLFGLALAMA
ncbi:MAG: PTS system mannose/fructose/sorbose family transporter subunit IID [Deltaproteobacteria bacterium]|jgi:mannose/fructose/N-acetylgalactosamine-specific phosphotransferase system component IID|nr:PTS system mannose/fructose/sorbose family transporter subunit IID [Deltaproteobacteria bacterium]